MSITIGCDIEGCEKTLIVLNNEDVTVDLGNCGWSTEYIDRMEADHHVCPAHKREGGL